MLLYGENYRVLFRIHNLHCWLEALQLYVVVKGQLEVISLALDKCVQNGYDLLNSLLLLHIALLTVPWTLTNRAQLLDDHS